MRHTDTAMEDHIKEAAMRIFFVEGKFHATPQDIAEAAGVTRTLLNYYFRSKSVLFELVLQQAHKEFEGNMFAALGSTLPFKQKIEHFIDIFLEHHYKFPHLETFLITEMNRDFTELEKLFQSHPEKQYKLKEFIAAIKAEIKMNTLHDTDPYQFIINLMSLLAHPSAMAPLFKIVAEISDVKMKALLAERKQVILRLLFKIKN
jgi:TetR/AcrR family transcriptional regulator